MSISEAIFRAYDVRGKFPEELNAQAVYAIGKAFLKVNPAKVVVVGHDHRQAVPQLKQALLSALTAQGVKVYDIGQVTTDMTYFSSWNYPEVEGAIMITASHLPGEYNGLKFVTKQYGPIGKGQGMEELQEFALQADIPQNFEIDNTLVEEKNVAQDYKDFVLSFVDLQNFKPLKIVADPGNGVGGPIVKDLLNNLPLDLTELYFEPNNDFPNHVADPFIPENRKDLEQMVIEKQADMGIAWDADADRAAFIDELGRYINGDFVSALLMKHFHSKQKNAEFVYDVRSVKVIENTLKQIDAQGHLGKVGHSYLKQKMRETGAVFGGETSGHFYFAKNQFMDNGMIPALLMLELVAKADKPLSKIIADLGEFYVSGEINSKVVDTKLVLDKLKNKFSDADINELDGISIAKDDWRFNVRASNTEPLLRLNAEAITQESLDKITNEVLQIIRG